MSTFQQRFAKGMRFFNRRRTRKRLLIRNERRFPGQGAASTTRRRLSSEGRDPNADAVWTMPGADVARSDPRDPRTPLAGDI